MVDAVLHDREIVTGTLAGERFNRPLPVFNRRDAQRGERRIAGVIRREGIDRHALRSREEPRDTDGAAPDFDDPGLALGQLPEAKGPTPEGELVRPPP